MDFLGYLVLETLVIFTVAVFVGVFPRTHFLRVADNELD